MTTTKYIWNWGLNALADVGYSNFNVGSRPRRERLLKVKDGNIVWIRNRDLPWFFEEIFPRLNNRFVLISADGNWSIPTQLLENSNFDLEAVLGDFRLIHWYTQNCAYSGSSNKLSPLPIGLDYHTIAKGVCWGEAKKTPADQESELEAILSYLRPTHERLKPLYVDIHLNNVSKQLREIWGENRMDIARQLEKSGCAHFQSQRMPRSLHWRIKGRYAFTVSAMGTGMDCHRTWESLVLGNIVIVKTSPLDPLYVGLPVVIISDWSEITEASLNKWLHRYGDAFENPAYRRRLTNDFWIQQARSQVSC